MYLRHQPRMTKIKPHSTKITVLWGRGKREEEPEIRGVLWAPRKRTCDLEEISH